MKRVSKKQLTILFSLTGIVIMLFATFNILKYSNGIDLIQLSPNTNSQMMGYILKTKNNKVIVIDGGTKGDSDNLLKYIKSFGSKVDYWFLTHPHKDHVGVFENIITGSQIDVKNIYVTLNDINLINEYEPSRLQDATEVYSILNSDVVKNKVKEVNLNEKINIDNVEIDILGTKNPEITSNTGNNSSMVLKLYVNDKSVLFLADSGIESGNKLIQNEKNKLKSDYVQMAHHGQSGVNENVYDLVNPTYCLWPTPIWLWNNDNGTGEDTGIYKTKETRSWINKLNVKGQYVAKDGDIKIRIW